jgi:hypothetical protein
MSRPASFTPNPGDIKMGPAIVIYDGNQLGYTMNDSVSINLTQETTPIQPDQASVPIADRVTGMECNVDMELGDTSKDIIKLIPGGDTNGVKDPTGIDMLQTGKRLEIYPLDSNDDRVFVFDKATPILNGAINFARETPSALPIQFKCYLASAGAYIMKFAEPND